MLSNVFDRAFRAARLTETAGTVINRVIPPLANRRTRITTIDVVCGSTAHTLSIMRALGRTTLSAAALASQAVINLTADPGAVVSPYTGVNAIAANDYLVIEKPDGSMHLGIVSSVATLAITLTANVPTGGFNNGADVWFFGIPSDAGHQQHLLTASARNLIQDIVAGVFTSGKVEGEDKTSIPRSLSGYHEPLIVSINNASAASFLERVNGYYARS